MHRETSPHPNFRVANSQSKNHCNTAQPVSTHSAVCQTHKPAKSDDLSKPVPQLALLASTSLLPMHALLLCRTLARLHSSARLCHSPCLVEGMVAGLLCDVCMYILVLIHTPRCMRIAAGGELTGAAHADGTAATYIHASRVLGSSNSQTHHPPSPTKAHTHTHTTCWDINHPTKGTVQSGRSCSDTPQHPKPACKSSARARHRCPTQTHTASRTRTQAKATWSEEMQGVSQSHHKMSPLPLKAHGSTPSHPGSMSKQHCYAALTSQHASAPELIYRGDPSAQTRSMPVAFSAPCYAAAGVLRSIATLLLLLAQKQKGLPTDTHKLLIRDQ